MENVAYTKIHFDTQKKLIEGAIELANVVELTMGPGGWTISIDRPNDDPLITKDGVTVARSIKIGNSVKNHGCQIIKQVANQAQKENGDGTTTAIVLAKALLSGIQELWETNEKDVNILDVQEGIKVALHDLSQYIIAHKIDVDIEKDIEILSNVAYISANNDESVSKLIMKAVEHSKGMYPIKINDARDHISYVESLKGMVYYNSVHHQLFMEILGVSGEKKIKNAKIFCTDHEISHLRDIAPLIEDVVSNADNPSERYTLVIICPTITENTLYNLFTNLNRWMAQGKKIEIVAVKAPEFGLEQTQILRDIAIFTGGKAVLKSEFQHMQDFHELPIEDFYGTAEFHLSRDQYSIVNGQYNEKAMEAHLGFIEEAIEEEESGYLKEKLVQRKAKLKGSVSIIYVGGETQAEQQELKARVDDAVNATKRAIKDGIVKGGGTALLEAVAEMLALRAKDIDHIKKNDSFKHGYQIMTAAAQRPFRTIYYNAGYSVDKAMTIFTASKFKSIVNARTHEVQTIEEAKIYDPCSITINSLKAAVSMATTVLSTKASITNFVGKPED